MECSALNLSFEIFNHLKLQSVALYVDSCFLLAVHTAENKTSVVPTARFKDAAFHLHRAKA